MADRLITHLQAPSSSLDLAIAMEGVPYSPLPTGTERCVVVAHIGSSRLPFAVSERLMAAAALTRAYGRSIGVR